MRAVWLEQGRLALRDLAPPVPGPGEALVRVLLSGVCGTDLELVRGYYSFAGVPGHEFVGRVEAAPAAPAWVGRRVVGEINAVCGACPACQAGRRSHCERRTVLGIRGRHGSFAEHLVLPVANLHAVPDDLPNEAAVFAEPAAAALRVLEQAPVRPGERALVVGAGRLGTLVAQALLATGCELWVCGRHEPPLQRLARYGAAVALGEVPPGRFDLVVDCTGSAEGLAVARAAVRPAGTIVLKSTYHGEAPVNLSSVVVDEVTLVGSRCGPFAPAIAALREGRIQVDGLVEARYPLARAPEALAHAARPGAMKVLIAP